MARDSRGRFIKGHKAHWEKLRFAFQSDVCKRYLMGESSMQIAHSEGCHKTTVLKELRRNNIKRRTVSEALTGKKPSDETRQKMRERMGGKGNPMYGKSGKLAPAYGRRGKLSPRWIDGRTPENKRIRQSIEYRLWRESVFARDNWICQKCKKQGGELHPHHIKGFARYPESRFAIDNGVTLCKECHKQFHKKYGSDKTAGGQWLEFAGREKDIIWQ